MRWVAWVLAHVVNLCDGRLSPFLFCSRRKSWHHLLSSDRQVTLSDDAEPPFSPYFPEPTLPLSYLKADSGLAEVHIWVNDYSSENMTRTLRGIQTHLFSNLCIKLHMIMRYYVMLCIFCAISSGDRYISMLKHFSCLYGALTIISSRLSYAPGQ